MGIVLSSWMGLHSMKSENASAWDENVNEYISKIQLPVIVVVIRCFNPDTILFYYVFKKLEKKKPKLTQKPPKHIEEEVSLSRNYGLVNRGGECTVEEKSFHVPFFKLCVWQLCLYCYINGNWEPSEVSIVTWVKLCGNLLVAASSLPAFGSSEWPERRADRLHWTQEKQE